ncbi:30S ribosomal protein S16 [Knoellia sp. S7-12]|uniref:30S ribosomal protein S16 n=1 Tax=Knoellia sp. S7-12 TaxID=3126698 RepID=UPI003368D1EC
MAVKIRLKRMGKIHAPFYRVVVMDSRTKRDGRAIEEIGKYHPTEEPSFIDIDGERAQYWLKQGAQPTEAVAALLKITGDWQQFKGEPGGEGTLKVKEPKANKKDLYEAALAAAGKSEGDDASGATTAKKKAAAKKADAPKAEKADEAPKAEKADEAPKAEDKAEEAPKAEEKAEEAPKADETAAEAADSPKAGS